MDGDVRDARMGFVVGFVAEKLERRDLLEGAGEGVSVRNHDSFS
jgi:hypothetical protein